MLWEFGEGSLSGRAPHPHVFRPPMFDLRFQGAVIVWVALVAGVGAIFFFT